MSFFLHKKEGLCSERLGSPIIVLILGSSLLEPHSLIATLETLQGRRPQPCIPSCTATLDYRIACTTTYSLQPSFIPLISISWDPIGGIFAHGDWCGVQGVMCSTKEQSMLHWMVSCPLGTLANPQGTGQPLGLQCGHR